MKNRKLLLIVSLVLALTMSLGGTLAYLTDTDSDVNTMTLGSVKIEQLEYQRVVNGDAWASTGEKDKYNYIPDELEPFEQNLQLVPAVFRDGDIKWDDRNGSQNASGEGSHQQSWAQVGASGSNQLFDDSVKNVHDKFVFVKNTGNSEAYVRTFFAFEQGSIAAADYENVIMTNSNLDHWSWETVATDVKINGNNYIVWCATYLGPKSNPTGILAKDAVSYPSLLQVYMWPECDNEDVEALDGNKNGKYDIIVLSQAVQADGFEKDETTGKSAAQVALEAGFPYGDDKNATIAGWLEAASTELPKVHQPSTAADLKAAVAEGGVVNLGGKTITLDGARGNYLTPSADTDVTISDGTIGGYCSDGELKYATKISEGNVVFDNVIFNIGEMDSGWAMSVNISGTANVTFRNCTFTGTQCPVYQSGANAVVTYENCTFEGSYLQAEIYSGDFHLGEDLIIKNCDFSGLTDVLHIYDYDKNPSTEDIIAYMKANGNTFTGTCKQTCN